MRAVVEFHSENNEIPPLKITIVKGREDLTIKVCFHLFIRFFGSLLIVFFIIYQPILNRYPMLEGEFRVHYVNIYSITCTQQHQNHPRLDLIQLHLPVMVMVYQSQDFMLVIYKAISLFHHLKATVQMLLFI